MQLKTHHFISLSACPVPHIKHLSLNSVLVHCNFVGNFQVDQNSDDFNTFMKVKGSLSSQYVLKCLFSCGCSVGRVSSDLRNEYV